MTKPTLAYTRTLDFIILAADYAAKGDMQRAAKTLTIASTRPDIKSTLSALDALQSAALAAEQARAAKADTGKTRSSALAKLLEAAAAKKAGKGKPAKKAKKAKANSDEFEEVLDDMVDETAEGEGTDDAGEVDLDLMDLEDTMSDDTEEMPLASEDAPVDLDGEALDEDEILDAELEGVTGPNEVDDEDSDDSDADEADEPPALAKTVTKTKNLAKVQSNLVALSRLAKK